jgi:hypothetical protein
VSAEAVAPVTITPVPTEEEAAAIVAALEVGLPRTVVAGDGQDSRSRWRWSGRWWSRPIPSRRERP